MSATKRVMNFKGLTIYIPNEINAIKAPKSCSTPTSNGPLTIIEKKKMNAAYYTTSNFQSNEYLIKNNVNSQIKK